MQRIAGDAEARADIFFAQQWISGNPAAQLGGQLAGVLHVGFRHEDDEFVSAVAGDDVRAPAVGLENVADTLQD